MKCHIFPSLTLFKKEAKNIYKKLIYGFYINKLQSHKKEIKNRFSPPTIDSPTPFLQYLRDNSPVKSIGVMQYLYFWLRCQDTITRVHALSRERKQKPKGLEESEKLKGC